MLARTFKIAWFNRGRYMLTIVAIALSVGFIVATLLLTFSLQNVAEPLGVAYADVDSQIAGPELSDEGPTGVVSTLIDPSIVTTIEAAGLEAYGSAAPYAQILDSDGNPGGQSSSSSNIAEAWLGDSPLNGYSIAEGRAPESTDELVLDASTAEDANLAIGDEVTVVTGLGVDELSLVGLAYFGGQDSVPYQSTVLLAANHPLITGQAGYSSVLVAGDGTPDEVTAQVSELLAGEPVTVISGPQYLADLAETFDSFLGFFQIFLTVFAVIAVIVGAVIVANTFTVSVAQRTEELALFRLIGSTRRQLMKQVVIEAVALGLVGTVVGIVVGLLATNLLDYALTAAGLGMERTSTISPIAILAGVAIGLLVTVFSSVRPAWKASATPPIEALRSVDEEVDASGRGRLLLGLGAFVVSVALLLIGTEQADMILTGVGIALMFSALIVLGPALIRLAAWIVSPILSHLGPPGLIASRNLSRNAGRTSAASLALMIGVALVSFFTLLGNTIGEFASGGAEDYLRADYIVQGIGDFAEAVISPDIVHSLEAAPGVDALAVVVEVRASSTEYPDELLTIGVTNVDDLAQSIDFSPDVAGTETIHGNEVLIGQDVADSTGLVAGDSLALQTEFGPVDAVVSAVVQNTIPGGFLSANILLDESSSLVRSSEPATYVFIKSGGATESDLDALVDLPTVDVLTRSDYIDGLSSALSSIIGLIYALLGVAIVIALVGIANTVSLAISERASEIGAMRAAGATRKQVFFSLVAEFSLLAVVGVVVGMVFALVAAIALFRALSEGEISMPDVDISTGITILSLGFGAGVLSSVWPARNAAMRDILDVLRSE